MATGKYLNFLAVREIRKYKETYDAKKGIYFHMNDTIGMDAVASGSLENSGFDITKFAKEYIWNIFTILGFAFVLLR